MDYILEPVAETDERNFCVEMMKRLDIQRKNDHFCDVILEVGSGDEQARLKAHKIVLCAASPFFYKALNSDMKEKKEGVIRLEETSKPVMEEVLEYLYTGHVHINEGSVFDLLAVADYFLISSLKTLCVNVLLQTLSFSSCIPAYYTAMKYRCEELMKKARDFIHSNFVAVAETENFLNLSSKQVEEWISSGEIVVTGEEEVFEILVNWIERNKSQKQNFSNLFCHIRCIYIPTAYLMKVILPDPAIKSNLYCSNLALDAIKMVSSGQGECYFAQPPRNCLKTHEDAIVACGRSSTWCYVPLENKWYKLADTPSKLRFIGKTICVHHGKLFQIGGNKTDFPVECYDPMQNSWSAQKSIQEIFRFSSVVTFLGFLYVIGGIDEHSNWLGTVKKYNPDTNMWQAVPSLSYPRSSTCAVADGRHLYVIGGNSNSGSLDIVERYDPKEKAWHTVASTLEKRTGAGGAAVNQKLYVFGGLHSENYSDSNFCEIYDPITDVWSGIAIPLSTASPGRNYVSVASFGRKIFVCHVSDQDDPQQIVSLQVYDTVRSEWKACANICQSSQNFITISRLRIPRKVLDMCEVLSSPRF